MSHPGEALQRLLYSAISDGDIAGGRIYDSVPPNPVFPYIQFGDIQIIGTDTACYNASDVYCTLWIWSRQAGRLERHQISNQIRITLTENLPTDSEFFSGFALQGAKFISSNDLEMEDERTGLMALKFKYHITH